MKKIIVAAVLVMAGLFMSAPVTQARPFTCQVRLLPPPPPVPVAVGVGPVCIQFIPWGWGPPLPPPPRYWTPRRHWAPPPPPKHRPKHRPPRPWR